VSEHASESERSARAFADSIEIQDWPPLLDGLDDFQSGQVICYLLPEGWQFQAIRRPDLPEWDRQGFEKWARERAYLLALTRSTEADGWFKRTDGGWQITARSVDMPPDPFLES
jgi:hypothetical protein